MIRQTTPVDLLFPAILSNCFAQSKPGNNLLSVSIGFAVPVVICDFANTDSQNKYAGFAGRGNSAPGC